MKLSALICLVFFASSNLYAIDFDLPSVESVIPKGIKNKVKDPAGTAPESMTVASNDTKASSVGKTEIAAFIQKAGKKIDLPSKSKGSLNDPNWVDINVKKGFCYTFEIKLGSGAKWKEDSQPSFSIDPWPNGMTGVGNQLFGDTGGVWVPSCAQHSGKASFGFMSYGPESVAVGTGSYEFFVYERKGSAKEVAEESAAIKKAHDESIRDRDAGRAKTCNECAAESPVKSNRKICVERRGLTMADCHW